MDTSRKNPTNNPLYVVRNNGVDVEEANGLLEMMLKKTGIDKLMPFLETFLQMILSEVQSYPVFIELKKMFDKLFEKFIDLLFQIQQFANKASI